jgi:hypothetical protein
MHRCDFCFLLVTSYPSCCTDSQVPAVNVAEKPFSEVARNPELAVSGDVGGDQEVGGGQIGGGHTSVPTQRPATAELPLGVLLEMVEVMSSSPKRPA